MLSVLNDPNVQLIAHLLLTGVSVLIVGALLPGMKVKSYGAAVVFACAIAILNALVWRYLGAQRGLVASLSSGAASLVLNGALFYAAGKLVPGVELSGCITAALAAFGVSFVNAVLHTGLKEMLR